ncbi:antitoxin VbhA family protein [Brenneria populi subsp. brevivirga]|uniref:antitoxin VbhA family protein n=1 Tax=Brenneria populi TaxID=1505588 RepID=UPI002E1756C5|nr:antitoxin VbhA family protein [Brenneria populi subsp. brevivirga]
MNEIIKKKRAEAFRKAEASLYLSGKDPRGSEFYEIIKDKVIKGELSYEEAKVEILNHHIGKSKKQEKANIR